MRANARPRAKTLDMFPDDESGADDAGEGDLEHDGHDGEDGYNGDDAEEEDHDHDDAEEDAHDHDESW